MAIPLAAIGTVLGMLGSVAGGVGSLQNRKRMDAYYQDRSRYYQSGYARNQASINYWKARSYQNYQPYRRERYSRQNYTGYYQDDPDKFVKGRYGHLVQR